MCFLGSFKRAELSRVKSNDFVRVMKLTLNSKANIGHCSRNQTLITPTISSKSDMDFYNNE